MLQVSACHLRGSNCAIAHTALSTTGTVLGCWLGAFFIPLDWDRQWQVRLFISFLSHRHRSTNAPLSLSLSHPPFLRLKCSAYSFAAALASHCSRRRSRRYPPAVQHLQRCSERVTFTQGMFLLWYCC